MISVLWIDKEQIHFILLITLAWIDSPDIGYNTGISIQGKYKYSGNKQNGAQLYFFNREQNN